MKNMISFKIADLESPYNGENEDIIKRNILYARIACRWCLENGYYPYASHLFFTQPGILDDKKQQERELGIRAGKAIISNAAEVSLFFIDFGYSSGMLFGKDDAQKNGRKVIEIRLFEDMNLYNFTFTQLLQLSEVHGLLPGGYLREGWS